MSQATLQESPTPLTTLTDDEILFRDNVRQFAEEKIRPLVREMDEKGVFDHDLLPEFFKLGLMGIEIPEAYGGGGGDFLHHAILYEEHGFSPAGAAMEAGVTTDTAAYAV